MALVQQWLEVSQQMLPVFWLMKLSEKPWDDLFHVVKINEN